jgi:hypothetical protein
VEGQSAEEAYMQQKQRALEEQQQAEVSPRPSSRAEPAAPPAAPWPRRHACWALARAAAHPPCCLPPQEERIAAARGAQALLEARRADVDALALLRGEPALIWRAAADLVRRHTSAGSAYVAQVLDPAEPEWAAPEEGEEGAGAETDDDEAAGGASLAALALGWAAGGAASVLLDGWVPVACPAARLSLPSLPRRAAAAKAEGEEEGEGEGQAEAEQAEGEEGEEGGEPKVALPLKPDYSRKVLAYVAASRGQEWLVGRQLRRCGLAPGPPARCQACCRQHWRTGAAAPSRDCGPGRRPLARPAPPAGRSHRRRARSRRARRPPCPSPSACWTRACRCCTCRWRRASRA